MEDCVECDRYIAKLAGDVKLYIQRFLSEEDDDIMTASALDSLLKTFKELTSNLERYLLSPNKLDHSHYQLIFQPCYLLFAKVLPQIDKYALEHLDAVRSVKVSACLWLSLMSRINPGISALFDVFATAYCPTILQIDDMISCWPLFLTDAFSEEKALEQAFHAIDVRVYVLSESLEPNIDIYKPSAPLLKMLFDDSQLIQLSAIKCLDTMITSKPLNRWMRMSSKRNAAMNSQTSKIIRHLIKHIRILTLLLVRCKNYGSDMFKLILEMFSNIKQSLEFETLLFFPNLLSACEFFISTVARISIDHGNVQDQSFKKKSQVITVTNYIANAKESLQWLCFSSKGYNGKLVLNSLLKLSFQLPVTSVLFKAETNEIVDGRMSYTSWLLRLFISACYKKSKLQDTLLLTCASLVSIRDIPGASNFSILRQLLEGETSGEHLLCAKILNSYIVESPSCISLELLEMLFKLMMNSNHLVKIAALDAVSGLNRFHWMLCFSASPDENRFSSIMNDLFSLMLDEKGTVRSSAYKAFGEFVCVVPEVDFQEQSFGILVQGCEDSKLAVRIQAMWCLSKVFEIKMLPLSLKGLEVISHGEWLRVVQIGINALQDSDKIQTTAIRCLSCCLACGCSFFVNRSAVRQQSIQIMSTTIEQVFSKYFPVWSFDNLRDQIVSQAHKLLCAIVDLIGCAYFLSLEHEFTISAIPIVKILLGIFRYGELQSRLTALRTLVSLMLHRHGKCFEAEDLEWLVKVVVSSFLLVLMNVSRE